MFKQHSVTGRIVVGKSIGLIIGFLVMLFLPTFNMPMISYFSVGTLLFFVLMGAVIGFMGQYDRHPAFNFKMPWYVRGPLVGMFFLLMYILFTYDELSFIMESALVSWMGFESPFWALIDGAVIGGIMGFVETKAAGEGPKLPLK
jgi:hypothetical protein